MLKAIESRGSVLLIFLAVVLLLPFLNKAVHVDDWVFILGAQRLLEHPYDPFNGRLLFFNLELSYFQTTHPPLYFFFIAWLSKLFQGMQVIYLHLGNLIFPLIALVCTHRLSKRFCAFPFWATLLVLTSYGFVIMAHSLMADVPVLAMFLLSIDLLMTGHEKKSPMHFLLCGFAALATWLLKYQGLALLPLFLLYAGIHRIKLKQIIPCIAVPLLGFALWSFYTWKMHGVPHLIAAFDWPGGKVHFYELDHIYNKFRAYTIYLGLFALPIAGPALLAKIQLLREKHYVLPWFFLLGLMILPYGYFPANSILVILGFIAGLFIIGSFANGILESNALFRGAQNSLRFIQSVLRYLGLNGCPLRSADQLFLALWAVYFYLVCVFISPYGIIRYFLPVLPPAAILLVNWLVPLLQKPKHSKIFVSAMVLQIALTFALAISDYKLSDCYRHFAQNLKDRPEYADSRIWFNGELGTRHYMREQGFRYLSARGFGLQKGDIVVRAVNDFGPSAYPAVLRRLKKVDMLAYDWWLPLRPHSRFAQGGYYSHYFSLAPFGISRRPLEVFDIYRVVR